MIQWPVNAVIHPAEHPRGWKWVPLLDVARLVTGHTPARNVPEYWDGGISWINLKEIRTLDGKVCEETALQVSGAGVAKSSAVVHPAGTICMSRTASVGFVTKMGVPMSTSQDFVNWIPGPEIDADYLMKALIASRPQILALCSGSTHKTMYVRDAERLSVLLPPIEEQRRIATVLDAADALRAKRRQAIVKLDSLSQAIFIDMFGEENAWPTGKLGEHLHTTSGGTPSRSKSEYFKGTIPWVKSGELASGTVVSAEEHVTEAAISDSSAKVMPKGTVLLAMYGATVGEVARLGIDAATNQAVCCLSPTEDVTGAYLEGLLRSKKPELLRRAAGGAQPNISQTIVRDMEISLPPLSAQTEYRRRVDRVEAYRDALVASNHQIGQLFASLQQRAFRGEL